MFRVTVLSDESDEGLGPAGRDRVEFLLSSNPGEPPRPLGRVASGGELSRIMLALKTVLAEIDQVPVLVFDEIDTGVGGAVAAAMGTRLRKLGAFHQVFCITHLPQVASQAEHHLLVEKGLESQEDLHVGESPQGDWARRGNRQNVGRADHYEKSAGNGSGTHRGGEGETA